MRKPKMVTLTFSKADALVLLDAVRHAWDDLSATIKDESGRDAKTDNLQLYKRNTWAQVYSDLVWQIKGDK